MTKSWRQPAILLWLLLLSALPACKDESSAAPVSDAVRPVKTFEVGSQIGGVSREWPGRIEPTQNAELSFNVAGDIISLPVEEGMTVERGQVLAKLDARQLRARLDRELADLRYDETEHGRSETLVRSGSVAQAELDRRTRALSMSKAAVSDAKKALEDATMVAPFTGTVAKKLVDNYQSVQAKQAVLILQDASSLEVVTHVSQRDYAAAAPGLSVAQRNVQAEGRIHVVLDTAPDTPIPARLKEIATVPDPITGTYEVTWTFEPPEDLNITPGMTAKVILDPKVGVVDDPEAERPAIVVPLEAVVGSDGGGAHVWAIDRERMTVAAVEVQTGEMQGDSIEILEGLAGGELLATTGVHALREGMVVSRYEDIYGDVKRAR